MPHRQLDEDAASREHKKVMMSALSPPAAPPTSKRFLPQPVEVSRRVRRSDAVSQNPAVPQEKRPGRPGESAPSQEARSTPRFKPEPVEMSTRTRKAGPPLLSHEDLGPPPGPEKSVASDGRRRFIPHLIETSKRSKRSSGDASTTSTSPSPSHARLPGGLETSPGNTLDPRWRPGERRRNRLRTASDGAWEASDLADLTSVEGLRRRMGSPRPPVARRQHSFQVPSLEPIESSESDGSKCPSLSTSPTAASDEGADLNKNAQKARKMREENLSGYLLELAAKAAENQLRDQAMAAFPNSDFHEPVNHFAVDRESDDSDEESGLEFYRRSHEGDGGRMRRDSAVDMAWEVRELRRHHERLERERRSPNTRDGAPDQHPKGPSTDPFHAVLSTTRQNMVGLDTFGQPKAIIGGWQRGVGLQTMRNAASPPMLGGDLKFRMFRSPQATTLEVDQCPASSLHNLPRHKNGGGLWKGYCVADDGTLSPRERRSSETEIPGRERSHHMVRRTSDEVLHPALPVTIPSSSPFPSQRALSAEEDRRTEEAIDREVTDEFVTQVYNYLSLGYPSLARKFDHELSELSRIPTEELSRDDGMAQAKGFVGLDEGKGITMKAATDGSCPRWKALRLYIREWMRQHPDRDHGHLGLEAWGARARRGSWGI